MRILDKDNLSKYSELYIFFTIFQNYDLLCFFFSDGNTISFLWILFKYSMGNGDVQFIEKTEKVHLLRYRLVCKTERPSLEILQRVHVKWTSLKMITRYQNIFLVSFIILVWDISIWDTKHWDKVQHFRIFIGIFIVFYDGMILCTRNLRLFSVS